jgi:hypothetical protein
MNGSEETRDRDAAYRLLAGDRRTLKDFKFVGLLVKAALCADARTPHAASVTSDAVEASSGSEW